MSTTYEELQRENFSLKQQHSKLTDELAEVKVTVKKLEDAELTNAENVRKLTIEKQALETQLKGASLNVGKNEHDISDLQATLDAEKETNELLQPVADAVYAHICTHLTGDYGLKGLPTAIRLFSERFDELTTTAADVNTELRNLKSQNLEEKVNGLNLEVIRLEREKGEMQAAAANVDETYQTVSELREALDSVQHEARIRNYALEYALALLDAETDRLEDARRR